MKRLYENLVFESLQQFPCVTLLGPRQCGKTTLLQTLPSDWKIFDLEKTSDFNIISKDPDLFLRLYSQKIAIDEAQIFPELFPALRVAIDADRKKTGRFLITGSSSPHLVKNISETLAGRTAIIEMAPLSYQEILGSKPSLFFSLLQNKKNPCQFWQDFTAKGSLQEVHQLWFKGGYPEPWLKNDERFSERWMDSYFKTYVLRDVGRLFPGINEARYQKFLQTLAACSGRIINYSEIASLLGVSSPTIKDYFEIAHGSFLWRNIPAYSKNLKKRTIKHPLGQYRDSGLLHFLLRIFDQRAMLAHPQMGRHWESFVREEILRNLNALGITYDAYFYRTSAGAEVDFILEGTFGLIPIEIKYQQSVTSRQLRALRDFVAEFKCPYGLVIHNAEQPMLYEKNILGLPFHFLF